MVENLRKIDNQIFLTYMEHLTEPVVYRRPLFSLKSNRITGSLDEMLAGGDVLLHCTAASRKADFL